MILALAGPSSAADPSPAPRLTPPGSGAGTLAPAPAAIEPTSGPSGTQAVIRGQNLNHYLGAVTTNLKVNAGNAVVTFTIVPEATPRSSRPK